MFAAHPLVSMLPETGFLRRYCLADNNYNRSDSTGDSSETVGALMQLWDGDERLQRLPRICWEVAARHVAAKGFPARRQLVGLYRELLGSAVAECLVDRPNGAVPIYSGDKDPRLVEYVSVLFRFFPGGHVIHIVRDPRDVLLSKMRAQWSRDRHWFFHVLIGRIHLDFGSVIAPDLFRDRYHVVRYEDLIGDPEGTLQGLVDEIGLPFDPAMLSFSAAASRLGGGKTEEWKKETLGPLLSDNSEKWRRGLTPLQIRCVEYASGRWMNRFGYQRRYSIGPVGWICGSIFSAGSLLYRLFRKVSLRKWRKVE